MCPIADTSRQEDVADLLLLHLDTPRDPDADHKGWRELQRGLGGLGGGLVAHLRDGMHDVRAPQNAKVPIASPTYSLGG